MGRRIRSNHSEHLGTMWRIFRVETSNKYEFQRGFNRIPWRKGWIGYHTWTSKLQSLIEYISSMYLQLRFSMSLTPTRQFYCHHSFPRDVDILPELCGSVIRLFWCGWITHIDVRLLSNAYTGKTILAYVQRSQFTTRDSSYMYRSIIINYLLHMDTMDIPVEVTEYINIKWGLSGSMRGNLSVLVYRSVP